MLSRNLFAVSRNFPCSTATLITLLEVEVCDASDPLPNFQTERSAQNARMIPESATFHRLMPSHRIFYAGDDSDLPARLRDGLTGLDCLVVRSPVDTARTLIRSDVTYSLLLFDDTAAGVRLERFARSHAHRGRTPVMLVKKSEGFGPLIKSIRRGLDI